MIRFEQHKHNPCYREVNKDFLDAIITEPKLDEFPYINPSLILMLCYGLIVYTREYWERTSNVSYDLLAKRICDESKEIGITINNVNDLFERIEPSDINMKNLLRRLRHAIAHAKVEYTENDDLFIFYDENLKNRADIFRCAISTQKLSIFLTGVGKYFINEQSPDDN